MQILLTPVGLIHTPVNAAAETPIQSSRSDAEGRVEVFSDFVDGLQDIETFSHLYLIYYLHGTSRVDLKVEPFLDDQKHGVFATRHPYRPNHIGISIVRLLSKDKNCLRVSGVDMFDRTPLLDIKPYVPEFDVHEDVRAGWYEHRSRG